MTNTAANQKRSRELTKWINEERVAHEAALTAIGRFLNHGAITYEEERVLAVKAAHALLNWVIVGGEDD